MRERRRRILTGALVGTVGSVGVPFVAVAAGGSALGWFFWAPLAVFAVALVLAAREQGNPSGIGLALGATVGLLIGAGVCVNAFSY